MKENGFANRNMSLFGITVGKIGIGYTVSDTQFECKSNLTRICAITELNVKSSKYSVGDGIVLPQGIVEYFETEQGEVLTIQGNAHLCCL